MDKIASELFNLAKGLVAASSVIQRNEVRPFVKYVMSFYNPVDGINPIAGLTDKDVMKALKIYEKELVRNSQITWGGGDSLDRERVRDIILKWRKMAASKLTAKGDVGKALKLLDTSKKKLALAVKGNDHFFPGLKEAELALAELRSLTYDDAVTQRQWEKQIAQSQRNLTELSKMWIPLASRLKEEVFDIENLQSMANFLKLMAK